MLRNIYVILATLAVLTTTGIATEGYGVEGEDYEEKAVLVQFKEDIEVLKTDNGDGVIFTTGIKAIDDISNDLGVYEFKQLSPLPEEPVDHPNGRWTWSELVNAYNEYGLSRDYLIRYTNDNTVIAAIDLYLGAGVAENAEPNVYAISFDTNPNDYYYSQGDQWYLNSSYSGALNMPKAWDYEVGTPSTVIAILDSGINMVHPDLKNKIYNPWDCYHGHDRPLDYNGHGTMCAGIAAASTNNATGMAGADWKAKIMPLRVWDSGGDITSSLVTEGLIRAMVKGADIISMSFGWWFGDSDSVHRRCVAAYESLGLLLFASAGNGEWGSIPKPARYGVVVAVGAINKNAYFVSGYSHGGEMELCAPGVVMFSTYRPTDYSQDPDLYPEHYNKYATGSGTSYSCPLVAGCAGLFWCGWPSALNTQIRGAMAKTARDLGTPGRDDYYGWGCVDPAKGLAVVSSIGLGLCGNGLPDRLLTYEDNSESSSLSTYNYTKNLATYPNPVSDTLYINIPTTGKKSISIYDIKGRAVYSEVINGNVIDWDLTNENGYRVSNGIYIIRIDSKEGETIKKVVIK